MLYSEDEFGGPIEFEDADNISVSAEAYDELINKLTWLQDEVNSYRIRDAEMEGWVSLPRERYLRLLGLESENLMLIDQVQNLEAFREFHEKINTPAPQRIVQPPEEIGVEDPFFFGTSGSSTPDLGKFRIHSTPPLTWQDTIWAKEPVKELDEEDLRLIIEGVIQRLSDMEDS